jgi:hypothetical protein
LWFRFLHHPLVASQLPKIRFPTLFGVFAQKELPSLQELAGAERIEHVHGLLLDRETRQLYLCRRDQAILFFSLTESDDENAPRVFIDGLRMSPGNEDYRVRAPIELAAQLLASLG